MTDQGLQEGINSDVVTEKQPGCRVEMTDQDTYLFINSFIFRSVVSD